MVHAKIEMFELPQAHDGRYQRCVDVPNAAGARVLEL